MTDRQKAHTLDTDRAGLDRVLSAVASECRHAAEDLSRLQGVVAQISTAMHTTARTDQMVALQDLDRLTQTLSALARTTQTLGETLPAQAISASDLRAAVALDSVAQRLLDHAAQRGGRRVRGTDQTTLF